MLLDPVDAGDGIGPIFHYVAQADAEVEPLAIHSHGLEGRPVRVDIGDEQDAHIQSQSGPDSRSVPSGRKSL
jgi:hypothetical protein